MREPKISGLVTLRYVVMSFLNRKGLYTLQNYKRFTQIIIELYSEFTTYHLGAGLEVIYLRMNEAKIVELPSDFQEYNKIGVPINGKLRVLTRKDSILIPSTFQNFSLDQVTAQFVEDFATDYLTGGVVVTASGNQIIFTAETAGVDFTGATTITNTSGDLAGTVVNTTPNAPGVKRVDTITLAGTYGTANILCDAVTKEASFDTGDEVGNTDSGEISDSSGLLFFTPHFRNGRFVGGIYGLPGGIDDAYYRVDYTSNPRRIIFSGTVPRSEVVVEYFSSGLKSDGSSLIPRLAVPALRAGLDWVEAENNPRAPYNEKERKKRIYEEEVSAMRHVELVPTSDEIKRAIYGSYRQSPKR